MAATRFIPRKTRVKTEFLKGVTGFDLIWIGLGLGATGLTAVSGLFPSMIANVGLAIGVLLIFVIGFLKIGEDRGYVKMWIWFRYFAFGKKYAKITGGGYENITRIVPYDRIIDENLVLIGDYHAAVIEIKPIEFGLLDNQKQEGVINAVANAFRRLSAGQSASIIRLERAMVLDRYIDYEIEKYENMAKNLETGAMSEEELSAREIIFQERGALLEYMNDEERVFKGSFFLVAYGSDKEMLNSAADGMVGTLTSGAVSMEAKRVAGKELIIFLRAMYNKQFDERELKDLPDDKIMNWVIPNRVEFNAKQCKIGLGKGKNVRLAGLTITDYPIQVSNAWAYPLFNVPNTRTVLNFIQVPKLDAEKLIDRAIIEMGTQMGNSAKASHTMDRETQIETTHALLADLKHGNEQMFDCNLHLIPEIDQVKEVKAMLREEGFKFSECYGRQVDSFVSANLSRVEVFDEYTRGIPTTTVAAAFPFISDMLQDDHGICLGSNSYPVFIDFFKRNNVRVNSNMIVIGKSGSGKSFCTKTVLSHLAADNTKIFICDPEKEYTAMAERLHGNLIDVGNAGKGRFNPFHVYPAMLDDDDAGVEFDDTFESHLRFLESFFKIVMEGIRSDALETLNGLVAAVYATKGIDKYTDFAKVQPDAFPTFDDLFKLAKMKHQTSTDDFSKINLRILITYLEKFAEGGRYSGLWNGAATIRPNENFVVFNFLTLLSNKNTIVANAQMLLVFKYLDGEIIKNREFNMKTGQKRKIIIVVDEAHVFIDEQKPIALDFMFQMAKRIRKYDGMQIIITQNIKDFVGSPIIAKKSAAIINASQYSMIFSLAPNDMTDLVTLYKNAGGINKSEQDQIVNNARGQCFFITGPMNRSLVRVEASDTMRQLFE